MQRFLLAFVFLFCSSPVLATNQICSFTDVSISRLTDDGREKMAVVDLNEHFTKKRGETVFKLKRNFILSKEWWDNTKKKLLARAAASEEGSEFPFSVSGWDDERSFYLTTMEGNFFDNLSDIYVSVFAYHRYHKTGEIVVNQYYSSKPYVFPKMDSVTTIYSFSCVEP